MEKRGPKVLILVNTLQAVSSFVYANHIEFFTYTAKQRPDIQFRFFTPHRMSIDNARNTAADLAMKEECDYLMFIDDDVMIPKDSLIKLIEADKDICAGLVIIRGIPFDVMAFRWLDLGKQHEDRAKEPETRTLTYYNDLPLAGDGCSEGHKNYDIKCKACHSTILEPLVQCDAVGFSLCLIKTDILHQLTTPFFVTGRHHTEDVYFCMKVQDELEPKPEIFMHTGLRCGHILNPEPVEWMVRPRLQEFYAPEIAKMKGAKEDDIRGINYLNKCLAKVGE